MEPFLRHCNDMYLALARQCEFNDNLRVVPTPFVTETHVQSPQAKLTHEGLAIYCPCCRHAFSPEESVIDAELKAALKELQRVLDDENPQIAKGTVGSEARKTKGNTKHTVGSGVKPNRTNKNNKKEVVAGPNERGGMMSSIAARILMRVLYAARMARLD